MKDGLRAFHALPDASAIEDRAAVSGGWRVADI